jgi:hypothetical protein
MHSHLKRSLYCLIVYGCLISTYSQKTTFTSEQIIAANTASSTKLGKIEKDVILYVNLVRMYPKQFFELYSDSMLIFQSLEKDHPNYVSLKDELIQNNSLPALKIDETLNQMAKEMAEDIGPNGIKGHTNSKNEDFDARADKFKLGTCAENISYGSNTGIRIVCHLLIDVYSKSLGHRKNILSADYIKIGAKYGMHKTYEVCCVMDFSN